MWIAFGYKAKVKHCWRFIRIEEAREKCFAIYCALFLYSSFLFVSINWKWLMSDYYSLVLFHSIILLMKNNNYCCMAKVNNPIILIFQLCVILEPMQELMSRHKTYNLNPRGEHFITVIVIIIIVKYISQDMQPCAPMLIWNNSLVVVELMLIAALCSCFSWREVICACVQARSCWGRSGLFPYQRTQLLLGAFYFYFYIQANNNKCKWK